MSMLLAILRQILNPRPNFSWLKRTSPETEPAPSGRRVQMQHIIFNFPLLLGSLIVLALFLIVLFGPIWAPENPYLAGQRTITYEDGVLSAPPFPPSTEFPLGTDQWGKDILSLLLYGARNTLVACTFIAMARLLLGLALGAIAGWNEGTLIDRAVMGAIGLTTALPILLSSMILIYALDIRRGLVVFIIAMSVVGWAEVAQYIRSEFVVLRQRPFIEGAHAVGLPGPAIAVRHILPNVLPQLIVITLLEMGAVLMLLGELGFIGVFIGGGVQSTSFDDSGIVIPDIPEWGAMLADARQWARAKPWMVLYPGLAFFTAVVGFNTLAEGLRRLIEQAAINTAFLMRRRMALVVIAITLITAFTINNVGPAPSYARLAGQFNGDLAYGHVETLTGFDGRGNGQPGGQAAADYIAGRFEEYGLQPAGRGGTYFHTINTRLVEPVEQPILALTDESGQTIRAFQHQREFGFVINGHGGSGEAVAPLAFVGFRAQNIPWEAYKGLDLRNRIVLILESNAPPDFATEAQIRGAAGVLIVMGNKATSVRSQTQLAGGMDYIRNPTIPVFKITTDTASHILSEAATDVDSLRAQAADWPANRAEPWLTQDLTAQVRMSLVLAEPKDVELVNVLGYLPGQDIALDDQLVTVAAHYDGLGIEPDGTVYAAANDNASGVAVLLEMIRLWQERGLTPRRTVLFAAWVGGELDQSGAEAYFDGYLGTVSLLNPVATFQLDNLGAGGDALRLETRSRRLAELLEESASEVGVRVQPAEGVYHPYQIIVANQTPSMLISWTDSQAALPQQDNLTRIQPEKLSLAGETIILALTSAARLPNY